MSNIQIAIDYANQYINVTKSGGIVVFPMFDNATKHDIKVIQRGISKNPAVASININKKFCIINVK